HTSIPFLLSMQQASMHQDIQYMKARMDDMLVQADMIAKQIQILKRIYELQKRMTDITHDSIVKTKEMVVVVNELRDHMSDFEDFFRPLPGT
uniref:hypothetical protein n=1 Tax=Mycobacterium avium TaxID=1764 RepID=UPI000A6E6006